MAELFGTNLSRAEILARVGDISQICDARRMTLSEGRASGVEIVEVYTGSGLRFTVVPSRGMDISHASFQGIPLAWRSSVGETSPFLFQPEGYEWLRSFFGGLLTTCGMTYASHPCEDEGESLGLHGRVSNIPAEDVSVTKRWIEDDFHINISGTVREVGVLKSNLSLTRRISTSMSSRIIRIADTVTNHGFVPSPLMMLYHINSGWPLLSETTRLVAPVRSSTYFDPRAEKEADQWSRFDAPVADYAERCYLHDMEPNTNGNIDVLVLNEEREIGMMITYPKREFPSFIEWKMMGTGEYVLGTEPGNITGNRADMRSAGNLEMIDPGAQRTFHLDISVIAGKNEIKTCLSALSNTNEE